MSGYEQVAEEDYKLFLRCAMWMAEKTYKITQKEVEAVPKEIESKKNKIIERLNASKNKKEELNKIKLEVKYEAKVSLHSLVDSGLIDFEKASKTFDLIKLSLDNTNLKSGPEIIAKLKILNNAFQMENQNYLASGKAHYLKTGFNERLGMYQKELNMPKSMFEKSLDEIINDVSRHTPLKKVATPSKEMDGFELERS